jgi:N-hydroxyarylamine O-acetyltransferase
MSLNNSEVARYLALLGVPEREPGLDSLKWIVRAQVMKVPFENISKLHRLKVTGACTLPDLDEYLDGIERYHFGGTCYANNYYLYQLLTTLGYDTMLCGADMSKPDVHIVSIVKVEGREYIVDAGYAAPFLEPLPRDWSSDYTISLGTDRYVLSPVDASGRSRLILYRDGIARHGYLVNPAARRIEEFSHVIADSYKPGATFMNALLLVKFGVNCSTILHNMTRIETRGKTLRKTYFTSTEELITAIQDVFLIPPSVSRVALNGLSMSQDAWS